jgi:hypothetical protein
MNQRFLILRFSNRKPIKAGSRCSAMLFLIACCSVPTFAQGGFVSGSTGADGAFNPTTSQTIQLPESGVFNFTTVSIPASVTIRFTRNPRNTPVTILAQGNVTIDGAIVVSGSSGATALGGLGGPGGYSGGAGGPSTSYSGTFYPFSPGVTGDGPGGGSGGSATQPDKVGTGGGGGFGNVGQNGSSSNANVVNGMGGPKYGLASLIPLVGGSGGGGETGQGNTGGGGGGGGGALLIASSTSITFVDRVGERIEAKGGNGANNVAGSGGGSGGAVRLIANIISGTLRINASGGFSIGSGGSGGGGYVRIEAFDLSSLVISPSSNVGSPRITTSIPGSVTSANLPVIRIVSVAGIAPPTTPNGSLQGSPDIILPANQSNPAAVALTASNIPLGTTLQITLTPENGARSITQSSALAGTLAASSASASVSIPDGLCVIQAAGTIDVAASAMMINGERVKSIEVAATFGGNSTVTYVTASNKRIKIDQ